MTHTMKSVLAAFFLATIAGIITGIFVANLPRQQVLIANGSTVGLEELIRLQPILLTCDVDERRGVIDPKTGIGYDFVTVDCDLSDGGTTRWLVPDIEPAAAYVGPLYADWKRLVGKTALLCPFRWPESFTPICPGLGPSA